MLGCQLVKGQTSSRSVDILSDDLAQFEVLVPSWPRVLQRTLSDLVTRLRGWTRPGTHPAVAAERVECRGVTARCVAIGSIDGSGPLDPGPIRRPKVVTCEVRPLTSVLAEGVRPDGDTRRGQHIQAQLTWQSEGMRQAVVVTCVHTAACRSGPARPVQSRLTFHRVDLSRDCPCTPLLRTLAPIRGSLTSSRNACLWTSSARMCHHSSALLPRSVLPSSSRASRART